MIILPDHAPAVVAVHRRSPTFGTRQDAVWLCKLAERGMLRPSFIPGRPQRQLRDLTRYRRTLVHERSREKRRAEKLLEDAQVKLSSVNVQVPGGRSVSDAPVSAGG
jgi:transposase